MVETRRFTGRVGELFADSRLQLRYILLVSGIAAVIAVVLAILIYKQSTFASHQIIAALDAADMDWLDETTKMTVRQSLGAADLGLVSTMAALGVGLAAVLVLALVVTAHRLYYPLRQVRKVFVAIEAGRLPAPESLRRSAALGELFESLGAAHTALRQRASADLEAVDAFLAAVGDAAEKSSPLQQALVELRLLQQRTRDSLG